MYSRTQEPGIRIIEKDARDPRERAEIERPRNGEQRGSRVCDPENPSGGGEGGGGQHAYFVGNERAGRSSAIVRLRSRCDAIPAFGLGREAAF